MHSSHGAYKILYFTITIFCSDQDYNISWLNHDMFIMHMVDSHESDAFGPYFEKVHFLNIESKQRLYITHSEARHLHLINSQHFFRFCEFEFF